MTAYSLEVELQHTDRPLELLKSKAIGGANYTVQNDEES
jgi:hypothetical protein